MAILATAGSGDIDGEPTRGPRPSSWSQFMARDVDLQRLRKVILCHNEDWNPPVTSPTDIEPIREELARHTPVELLEMGYLEDWPIFRLAC